MTKEEFVRRTRELADRHRMCPVTEGKCDLANELEDLLNEYDEEL